MKLFLAIVGGFAMTLVVFAAGVVLATVYFVAPSRDLGSGADTAAMWTSEPVRVAGSTEPFAPDAQPEKEVASVEEDAAASPEVADDANGLDLMTTAAVAAEAAPARATQPDRHEVEIRLMRTAHDDWCSAHFRSYRAEDNSFQPYRGPREPCMSPYLPELEALTSGDTPSLGQEPTGGEVEFAVMESDASMEFFVEKPAGQYRPADLNRDHIQSCFDRYRSYRPEDNSYQPYGGGPRRQCM